MHVMIYVKFDIDIFDKIIGDALLAENWGQGVLRRRSQEARIRWI